MNTSSLSKHPLKLVIIGGGSSYTPELLDGLVQRREQLPVGEIVLVDIPAGREKAEIILGLARRIFAHADYPARIRLTFNREEALAGADFVITQIRVGGLDARVLDEKIPLQYGLIGQETTGAGGFAKALRTIPVILEIAHEMERLCPTAWLINFTNPSGIVTEALHRHSTIRSVGLCNVPANMAAEAAHALGLEPQDLYIEFVGLNHLSWIKEIWHQGRPVLKDLIAGTAGAGLAPSIVRNIPALEESQELVRSIGMIPSPYLQYFYREHKMLEEERESVASGKGVRGEQVKRIEEALFALYRDPNLCEKPEQLSQRGGALYSQVALSLITSLLSAEGAIHVVNTPNNGAFPELPREAVVETNCLVNAAGIRPLTSGSLPLAVRGLVQQVKSYEELTVQAAVTGSKDTALAALMANPLVHGYDNARNLLDHLLTAHRQYLPQFQ
jgi:6-phospho-beta-glucosidase